jgi:DNA-binding NarL/FixJ family response regulator
MMSEHIRVLIADDHPVVRDGIRAMLDTQPDLDVIGEATTGDEAVELTRELRPDVVLMDLQMPHTDGPTAIAQIRARDPQVNVLVLTTYDTDSDITRSIDAGTTGYLLKETSREDLFTAIRSAARGKSVLSPAIATRVLERIRAPIPNALSGREIDVLTAVARGLSNKDIAAHLHISEATVKTHLLHIFTKLDVSDRTAAVTLALDRGIIRLGSR